MLRLINQSKVNGRLSAHYCWILQLYRFSYFMKLISFGLPGNFNRTIKVNIWIDLFNLFIIELSTYQNSKYFELGQYVHDTSLIITVF